MRCYRCNSVLSDADICESCGTDVVIYKKIVKMSNTYYNMGLAKAKVRDLSGAADLLRRSVRIDKNNINARNLLGLVYFEMGECVEALSEWVISKNLKPEKNIADEYIRDVQSNQNRLSTMNQTIKKFNKALGYAWEGNDDLAIIQLKKVLSLNPNLIKGHLLLALLLMKKEEYSKARKSLNKVLKIDVNNTLAIKYQKEIDALLVDENGKKVVLKSEEESKPLSGNDVIIPKSTYRETNYALVTFINVLIGIVIGAAMVYFLVTPAKESSAAAEYKSTITDYASKLDKANGEVASLEDKITELEAERDEYKAQVDSASSIVASTENTNKLIEVAKNALAISTVANAQISNEEACSIADALSQLGDISKESDNFKKLYEQLKNMSFTKAGQYYYNLGAQYSNNNEWDDAIEAYKHCVAYNDKEPSYLYKLGKSIYKKNNGNTEESKSYFNKVIEIAPNSEFAEYSKGYLN